MVKLFDKDITKGVIGNAVFQVLWNGVSAMIGIYTAHSAYINGVPIFLVITIGVVIFFLLSLAWFLINARRHKQEKGEPPSNAGIQQLATEQTEVVFNHLLYTYPLALFTNLTSEGYINFSIQVFNGSPYDVTVENGVRGYILMDDKPFPDKPLLTVTKFAPPEDRLTALDIRQAIDERTADELDESFRRGEAHSFAFTNLDIYFVAQLPDGQVRRRLTLPDGVHCKAGITSGRLVLVSVNMTATTSGEVRTRS